MQSQSWSIASVLRCPYCWGSFEIESAFENPFAYGACGWLRCPCSSFPVLHGIPILLRDYWTRRAASLLAAGKFETAVSERLAADVRDGPWRRFGRRVLRRLRVPNRLGSKFEKAGAYRDVIRLGFASAPAYAEYLRCRFADLTCIAAETIINHMAPGDGLLLDVPSGAGHVCWALRRRHPQARIMAMDVSFFNLLGMKRFLMPDAACVCSDANLPLPFQSGVFGGIVCSDGLHYISAQASFLSELRRVASGVASILLLHVHNRSASNCTAGYPVELTLLKAMLDGISGGWGWEIWDERQVISLAMPRAKSAARELTATEDAQAFDAWLHDPPVLGSGAGPIQGVPIRGKWIVNPMYKRSREGLYELRLPNSNYEREFGEVRRFLPGQIRPVFSNGNVQPTAELVKERAVLFVPEGF